MCKLLMCIKQWKHLGAAVATSMLLSGVRSEKRGYMAETLTNSVVGLPAHHLAYEIIGFQKIANSGS